MAIFVISLKSAYKDREDMAEDMVEDSIDMDNMTYSSII